MTVSELIDILKEVPPDHLVVLNQSIIDGVETYGPLKAVNQGTYCPDESWCGEFVAMKDTDTAPNAVALWPGD